MRMKPIGKVIVSPAEKKRRRARRVAESVRDVLDLYERYEDVRKHGGTTLAELTRKIEARTTSSHRRAAGLGR